MQEPIEKSEATSEGPDSTQEKPKHCRILGLRLISKRAVYRVAVLFLIVAVLSCWGCSMMIRMPGKSYKGPQEPLTSEELAIREELRRDVKELATNIGKRSVFEYDGFTAAVEFIKASLADAGYEVMLQDFTVERQTCSNISVEVAGDNHAAEIVIIGAHYDSVFGTTGANDNGSGVAATLALARRFANRKPQRTLRFVLFANEEPPFFQTEQMGSFVYAADCRGKEEQVVAMLSLETIGYYTDAKDSQNYPFPFSLFYPSTGDFIGFVGDFSSRKLVRRTVGCFRQNCRFPSQGGAIPRSVPGIGWSDHWAFWQHGYPALMVTDTAPFRYPYYHTTEDTPDRLDYDRFARVTRGLEAVVADLADSPLD